MYLHPTPPLNENRGPQMTEAARIETARLKREAMAQRKVQKGMIEGQKRRVDPYPLPAYTHTLLLR